ncbi:hypothetical protein D3C87_1285450 [compost metagenome]
MAFIRLTDYDGYPLVLNSEFIASVTVARSSYGGNQANVQIEGGTVYSVRDTPEQIYAAIEASQQQEGSQ